MTWMCALKVQRCYSTYCLFHLHVNVPGHEAYLQLKETEYAQGLDIVYIISGFHIFSSFKLRAAHFRAANHLLKFMIILFYASLFNHGFYQVSWCKKTLTEFLHDDWFEVSEIEDTNNPFKLDIFVWLVDSPTILDKIYWLAMWRFFYIHAVSVNRVDWLH